MRNRILTFVLCTLFLTGLLSACDKTKTTENTTDNTTADAVITPIESTKPLQTTKVNPTNTVPVTTAPIETTEEDDTDTDFNFPEEGKRPYAVMIDNEGTRPLPQGGLDKAQIIYEIIIEYGATRLMPLFWNEYPEMIGPVRSARHYFIEYALEHDSLYVHIGWSPKAERYIIDHKIQSANGVKSAWTIFWDLTKDRKNYQDSYTSMDKIIEYMSNAKYRTTTEKPLVFEYNKKRAELESQMSASEVEIKYSYYKCSYSYDNETQKYNRFREGKPHMERNSGEQLAAANIIIQYVKNYRIKGDNADRQELDNVGEGKGYFITLGKAIEITWSKSDIFEPTIYKDMDGNKIKLNPGQTWIQVVPVNAGVTIK